MASIAASFRVLICLVALLSGLWANRSEAGTNVRVCPSGGVPLYVAVYETGGGLMSGQRVDGWYLFTSRFDQCITQRIYSPQRLAFAFATLDGQGRFVPLTFRIDRPRGNIRNPLRTLCVPVQRELTRFTLTGSVAVPPCAKGHFPLPVSLNIVGGGTGVEEEFTINFGLSVEDVPSYSQTYRTMHERLFAPPSREALPEVVRPAPQEIERPPVPKPAVSEVDARIAELRQTSDCGARPPFDPNDFFPEPRRPLFPACEVVAAYLDVRDDQRRSEAAWADYRARCEGLASTIGALFSSGGKRACERDRERMNTRYGPVALRNRLDAAREAVLSYGRPMVGGLSPLDDGTTR